MARSRQRSTQGPPIGVPGAIMIALILILVVALLWFIHLQHQRSQQPPVAQNESTAPAPLPVNELISEHGIVLGGLPRPSSPVTVVRNSAYLSGYSETRKDPLFVCYHVIHNPQPFHLARPTGNFVTDTRTTARTTHEDFTGSGFDRGHMAPNSAIAHCFGADAQKETFLLSNICPQAANLNEKVWEKLEAQEVPYADKSGEVWVTDGPIFPDVNGGTTRKLRSGIAVPAAFYKILAQESGGRVRVFSVIMPQTVKGTELPGQFLTSVAEIEKETGIEFLPELTGGRELKAKVWPMW